MTSTLVIPRKDARLAGLVMGPALIVVLGVILLAALGDSIPGVSRMLWERHAMPSLAERMARIQWLMAGACFIVPCWASVVIALGDGARRAQYLATTTPAQDSSKAMSKLLISFGCAMVIWILYSFVAAFPHRDGDPAEISLRYLQVLAIAVGGAACGLGAANLLRRIMSAGILAMIIPFVGLPVGYVAVRTFVEMPGSQTLTHDEWARFTSAREVVQLFAASAAALAFALVLAGIGAPMLAGRDTRPRVMRALMCAACGAIVVGAATTLIMSQGRSSFGKLRAMYEPQIAVRAKLTSVADAALLLQYGKEFGSSIAAEPSIVLALASGEQERRVKQLVQDRLDSWAARNQPILHFERSPALFEIERRQELSRARIDAAVRPLLADNTIPIAARIVIAGQSLTSNVDPNLARLLVTANDEMDRACVIAELARVPGQDWREYFNDHSGVPWCQMLDAVRARLEGALPFGGEATDSPGNENAIAIRQAIDLLARPMNALAERAAKANPQISPKALECIRKGLPPRMPLRNIKQP